jgi:hypothetical protein
MEFLSGYIRTLEQTRAEWYTAENLQIYFDDSKGVLLKAGVIVLNRDFDPEVPHSQEIMITHPERICFYDETKMVLDCTKGRKGRFDAIMKWGPDDDGTVVVTKFDKFTLAVCGRLGDGRDLSVFMCYAFVDS